ncbi:hypothetical protein ACN9MN_03605 [Chryseobacterium sp. S-02]|uniref:hypothetical protein n=1 Tax=Chryseobacterium sp. S-02 TaxID=3404064 RepID=UPI003CF55DE8
MRSIQFLILLFLVTVTGKGYAQIGVGDVVTTPVASPSMAAMSQYSDVPMSLSTGYPEIGVSLMSAPVSGGINWPMSLSYNTRGVDHQETASDVGNGWSFFGAGVIYKKVIDYLDECYDNTSLTTYKKNEFDDLYYYNLPGLSGKFRIKRDTINNTFQLLNLTPNHARIDYVRNINTATFKADSFTVTSDDGYKYIFDKTDLAKYDCGDYWQGKEYKTAYYLSKILNPIGVEVAVMEYDERKKYKGTSTTNMLSLQNKLKTITSRNGQVSFSYTYDETLEPTDGEDALSDPYSLQRISLKDPAGSDIFSYVFNYTMVSKGAEVYKKQRILNSVVKNDKNGTLLESNRFLYESSTGEGILKKMISPTGGVTEYNYGWGEIYHNFNDPAFLASLVGTNYITYPGIQYWAGIADETIDTTQSLSYPIMISGNTSEMKNFRFILNLEEYSFPEPLPGFPVKPNNLKITLKRGTQDIVSVTTSTSFYHEYLLGNYPGTYTLEITSTGGATGTGSFNVSEVKVNPGPFRNAMGGPGRKIENIKTYKNINDTSAFRTVNYEYDSFDLPNSSSGYMYYNERDTDNDPYSNFTLYRNVKEFETGKGSVRYSFKTPDDYPKQQTGGTALEPEYFWPYYNITKGGLMSKKEVYDEQNTLLTTELYDYELDTYSDDEYSFNTGNKTTSKPSYIKKSTVTNKAYFPDGGILESGSETWISLSNMKPYYIKSAADGDISEQFITYAIGQPGYDQLENAFMTGIPIIQEDKKNGKTLSKAVTQFENSSLLPTSVWMTNISDGSVKLKGKMDAYDDKGNVVQASSGTGTPTTFIYGYNKTQLIAKVVGAKYEDIKTNALVLAAVTASDNDNTNPATESTLITALENLRTDSSMSGYQITTYTYDPLVGLTTTTSPNGQRELYEYDRAGRPKKVKSAERNNAGAVVEKTLKEYQYNYKP